MKDFNFKYPPATGKYKVAIIGKSVWQGHTTARLQISVGQPKHTGEKFKTLTEWASMRFDKVVLIVSDTLQRHNIAFNEGISLEDAHRRAWIMGQEWIRENRAAIDLISPHKRIIATWEDWITHPDYQTEKDAIMELFRTDENFRATVRNKATEFSSKRGSIRDFSAAYQVSLTYLLEEIPAFKLMMRDGGVDIYPGPWMRDIFSAIPDPVYQSASFLSVDYKRNRACA